MEAEKIKNNEVAQLNVTRIIHWSFACFLVTMLSIGFYMKNTAYSPDLYQIHKSLGVLFCLLVLGRLYWRIKHPWQSSSQGANKARLVKGVHLALIALMLLMPITGFMLSALSGFGIHLFGTFIVPEYFDAAGKITPINDTIYQASKTLHNIFAYTFSILITGHILAALKHHFVNKDNTLKLMLKKNREVN